MPPKARISREMIVNAAFEIARVSGADQINARTVAKKLGCSTQPVMYYFATIRELKAAVYAKLDWYHTDYLMNISGEPKAGMLGIGQNYIRFAVEEPHLFRFLFQSSYAVESTLIEMIDSPELLPVISAMQKSLQMSTEQTKKVFLIISLFAHGYASIIANNNLEYHEDLIAAHLEMAYRGAILAVKEEENEETVSKK